MNNGLQQQIHRVKEVSATAKKWKLLRGKICTVPGCTFDDVVEMVPDEKDSCLFYRTADAAPLRSNF